MGVPQRRADLVVHIVEEDAELVGRPAERAQAFGGDQGLPRPLFGLKSASALSLNGSTGRDTVPRASGPRARIGSIGGTPALRLAEAAMRAYDGSPGGGTFGGEP